MPVVAPAAYATVKRTARELSRFAEFERELLTAPCPRHSSAAVCDGCAGGPKGLDSLGFPSATRANGRGRYRYCPTCRKLFDVGEWLQGRQQTVLPIAGVCPGCAAPRD